MTADLMGFYLVIDSLFFRFHRILTNYDNTKIIE